jgi:capsular exopolysaccharide synthesis family protein
MLEARIFRNETIRKTDVPFLDVITSGKAVSSPAELIASPFMPFLVQEARSRYDYVVIDAPPLLSLTDTPLLARHVDGLVMVVRAGATPREVVVSALEQVADRRVFGVVVNGLAVDDPHYSYHYHYYGHDSEKGETRRKA